LKIGANGNTTGNIFNVVSNTSSLFSVSQAGITNSLPTSFTAPGDLSDAYDLQFTNPTASYIKSNAPLYVQAGPAYASNNLTFQTFNAGNIVFQASGSANVMTIAPSGNVGIGTSTISGGRMAVFGNSAAASGTTSILSVSGSQTVANSGFLLGVNAFPSYVGTTGNTLTSLYGVNADPINASTGTVTNMYGLVANPINNSSGNVGTSIGVFSRPDNNSSGTITTADGVYIAAPLNTGTITNKYALLTEAAAGNVGIGSLTPTQVLDVNGNIGVRGNNIYDSGNAARIGLGATTTLTNTTTTLSGTTTLTASSLTTLTTSASLAMSSTTTLSLGSTAGTLNGSTGTNTNFTINATSGTHTTSVLDLQASGGNVGIGTTTTPEVLTVKGHINFTLNGATDSTIGVCKAVADATTDETGVDLRDCSSTPSDIGEFYVAQPGLHPGDVVSLKDVNGQATLVKTQGAYDSNVTGVVSTYPIGPFGKPLGATLYQPDQNPTAVALTGKVPVIVNLENGPIKIGDALAPSSTPGVVMKATQQSKIIGYALDNFDGSVLVTPDVRQQESWRTQGSFNWNADPVDPTAPGTGKIMVFTNVGWYSAPQLWDSLNATLAVDGNGNPEVNIGTVPQVNAVTAKGAVIGTGVFGKVTVAGQDLHDFVASVVNSVLDARVAAGDFLTNSVNTLFVQQQLIAPVANLNQVNSSDITSSAVHTTTITPVSTDSASIAIRLDPSVLSIVNTTNSGGPAVVTQLDNAGNATFSGTVQAQQLTVESSRIALLQANEASISGTLYATHIDGLDNQISAAAQQAVDAATASGAITYTQPQNIADLIASLLPSNDASTEGILAQLNAQTGKNLTTADVSAPKVAIVEDLLNVKGLAEFSTANFSNGLSIGSTLNLSQNSIDATNTTLYLEPSGSGSINLLAGVMTLESNGLVTITGNLYVSDAIYSKEQHTSSLSLSPIDPNTSMPAEPASNSGGLGKLLALYDDKGNLVSSIDASGSAAVKQLITEQVVVAAPASSSSGTLGGNEQSNATAGTAILPANATSITISNTNVTDNTLIYITPVSNTHNQVLYVSSKSAGQGFTVSTNAGIGQDITFNYWLIKIQ
jgi:hypothetical protein